MMESSVHPFENDVLNQLVLAFVDLKAESLNAGAATWFPLRLPPLPEATKRGRSRKISLDGIRDAKREEEEEEAAKGKAFALFCNDQLVPPCNGNGKKRVARIKTQKKKKSKAAPATASKGSAPVTSEPPKFVMYEAAPRKLVIKKMKDFDKEDEINCKREIPETLAEENMSDSKKVKLMSPSQPEPMITASLTSEAAELCAPTSSCVQRAPFNPM